MPITYNQSDGTEVTDLTCAETAKLLRGTLKAEFPDTKFNVRSKVYTGGASITVFWTDGPTRKAVQRICDRYEGADFDGMTDIKSYHTSKVDDGQGGTKLVRFGADWIFTVHHETARV